MTKVAYFYNFVQAFYDCWYNRVKFMAVQIAGFNSSNKHCTTFTKNFLYE